MIAFKYCDKKGIEILRSKRLKIKQISEFDDPYEFAFSIDTEEIRKNLFENPLTPETRQEYISKLNLDSSIDDDSIKELVYKACLNEADSIHNILLTELKHGLVCLSAKNNDLLMWANYTDGHRGLVLGFDLNKLGLNSRGEDHEYVCYSNNIPVKKLGVDEDAFFKEKVIYHKSDCWAYQEEIRAFVRLETKDDDSNYYMDIIQPSLVSVYFGCRCSDDYINESIKLLDEWDSEEIGLFKAQLNKKQYKMEFQKI